MTTFFVLIYNKGIIIRRRMFSIYACICVCACDFMPFEICSVLRTHPHAFSPYSYIYPIVMHTIDFPGTKNSLCVAMSFRYRGNMCMISVLIWVCPSSLDPNLWGDRVVSLLLACGNVLAFDPRLFDGNRATRSCGNISITARSRPTNSHPGDIPLGGEQTDSGDMPTCRSIRLARR